MNNKVGLTKDDLEILNSLETQANSIASLYQKLYELELAGKKGDPDYRMQLEYLGMALEVEKKHYDKLSFEQINLMCQYLDNREEKDENILDHIINQTVIQNPIGRMIVNLYERVALSEEHLKLSLPQEMVEITELIEFAKSLGSVDKDVSEMMDDEVKHIYSIASKTEQMKSAFQAHMLATLLQQIEEMMYW